jgi:predicted RNA-binding Zn ribbon-like protein
MGKANNTLESLGSAVHAAKRAADIVFVLQNKDRLDYQGLVNQLNEVLSIYGEQNSAVTYADLDDLKTASRKLHAIFEAQNTAEAAQLLNVILSEYACAPRLSTHGDTPWHVHVDSNDHAPWAEWFAASSALALATLLAEKQRNPGGLCASPTCGRPFIDLGKGGGRSYCSPKCATRERVAAYRKKERT